MNYTPNAKEERAYRWYAQWQMRSRYRKARLLYRLRQSAEKVLNGLTLLLKSLGYCFKRFR